MGGGSGEYDWRISSPPSSEILHCILQMQSYPEMLNRLVLTNLFYFKSTWVDIRAAAPMFIGKVVPAPCCCFCATLHPHGSWEGAGSPLHPVGCTDPDQLIPSCWFVAVC